MGPARNKVTLQINGVDQNKSQSGHSKMEKSFGTEQNTRLDGVSNQKHS